jgi:predicted MPP superfamily phosphohydrolase
MEDNLIHHLLVRSNQLQALPASVVTLILVVNAALVWLAWSLRQESKVALLVALSCLLASLLDWRLLYALPRAGRSYGPDKPPALALSALRTVVVAILGLTGVVWLGIVAAWTISAIAFYATWLEPFRLGVTCPKYVTAKWQSGARPLRLLHIGDLHVERLTPRERQLNRIIKALKPDVIVFSGDFVNISYVYDPEAEKAIREVISEWHAPLGVYCVPGTYTVEPLERVRDFTRGLDNLRLLTDDWLTFDTPGGALNLLGMVTTHYLDEDRATLKRLMAHAPTDGLNLLLTHAPDVAPEANQLGVDLYLCGHTHGGQLRLPFIGAIFTGSQTGRRFAMGRVNMAHTTVYTTRGVGLEGLGAPRARFLCPPEIILWEISGQA